MAQQRHDIDAFLQAEAGKEILRFSTAGSVDDGKSTLIGRLLVDARQIYRDQVEAVQRFTAQDSGKAHMDYAFLLDGLKAEREQGITIDVAYRYFSTPRRKFIIADTPGHEQYTRNMATGASTADLTLILIDASKGVLTQTRRHLFIASLLGIPHFLVVVNKMDLAGFAQEVFERIKNDVLQFAQRLNIRDLRFIPVSALQGDNLLKKSRHMPWYQGEPLLQILETVNISGDRNLIDLRFPVQYVLRPNSAFRGYAGVIASGVLRSGDTVQVLPSLRTSRVRAIETYDGPLTEAFPPLAVTVTLDDELDISRGDMLVHRHNIPRQERSLEAMVVWMDQAQPLTEQRRYLLKHTTRTVPAVAEQVMYAVDVDTLSRTPSKHLALNEIGRVVFSLAQPIFFDPYDKNRATGSFILIDTVSNTTVGAGMIIDRRPVADMPAVPRANTAADMTARLSAISTGARGQRLNQKGATLWLTGLVGAGKTHLAYALEQELFKRGGLPIVLDGENIRLGISRDLDFSESDRAEHHRRVAEIAKMVNDAGLIAICAFASPVAKWRAAAAERIGAGNFVEIHVSSPLEYCRARQASGLYGKAERGEIKHFPGVHFPYEAPQNPALVVPLHEIALADAVESILAYLAQHSIFPLIK